MDCPQRVSNPDVQRVLSVVAPQQDAGLLIRACAADDVEAQG